METFTNHLSHPFYKRWTSLTKTVKLFVTFFFLSTFFINAQTIAPVVQPTNRMRLDGHLKRQTDSVGDWCRNVSAGYTAAGTYLFNDDGTVAAPFNGAEYAGLIFHKVDLQNNADDEGFDGGNKLFHDPNTWGWSSKKQLGKDDMNNSLVFITRDAQDHIWVLISGDRRSENGTSYLDFEFYKNTIVRTGEDTLDAPTVGGTGRFLSHGPNGGRTIGDLSVTLSFTSGGSIAGVSFLQWEDVGEGTYDYVSLTPDPGEAFVAANTVIVDVPFSAFGINTYAPNLFVEAAIDVTALIGNNIPNQCGGLNFKSLFIKTKSSAEKTADLKDFIDPFSITLCGDRTFPVITSGGSALALGCNPSASALNAALGTASASDNCGTPSITSADGSVSSSGCNRSQTRTWTATDGCGNVTTGSRTATWTADNTAPGFIVSGNNSALGCNPAASSINAALGSATATDACGAPSVLTGSDGSISSSGCSRSQTRTWTAVDGCGNTSSTSRTATWTEASTLTISCPPTVYLQCSGSSTNPTTTGTATASGGCNPQVNSSDQSASSGCRTVITRTWRATDDCGQSATCVQKIVIADTTRPVITCGTGGSATVSDNCSLVANIVLFLSGGEWTAIDEAGNIATKICPVARMQSAPVEEVITPVEETKTPIAEEKNIPVKSGTGEGQVELNKMEVYAYPNPFTDQVTFRFVPAQSGIAKLELYDMTGRQVSVINIGKVQAGVARSINHKIPGLKRVSMIYKITVGSQHGNGTLISAPEEP